MPEKQQRRVKRASRSGGGKSSNPMLDIHLRFGLEDIWFRLPAADFQILMTFWIIGAEDIVLRCVYEHHERDIILRGTSDAIMSSTAPNPAKRLPVYNAYRIDDMRKEYLEKVGM